MAEQAHYPSLTDKVVLVTGGGSGIGSSIVRHFAAQGAHVAFLDYNRPASEALVEDLATEGITLLFEFCDLREIEKLRQSIAKITETLGPITVLINNAARDDRHSIESVTPEYWDERIATNIKHQFFAAQAVSEQMKQAGGGSIINIGSTSWMIGQGGMPCYTTAKSAVQGLTRGLARDLGPYQIRVNTVVPGWIMTERQIEMWLTPESEKELLERQCVKRRLVPDDLARFVLFMASDEASACSNQSFIVDGGWV